MCHQGKFIPDILGEEHFNVVQVEQDYLCARHKDRGIEYIPNKVGYAEEIGSHTSGKDPRWEWGIII